MCVCVQSACVSHPLYTAHTHAYTVPCAATTAGIGAHILCTTYTAMLCCPHCTSPTRETKETHNAPPALQTPAHHPRSLRPHLRSLPTATQPYIMLLAAHIILAPALYRSRIVKPCRACAYLQCPGPVALSCALTPVYKPLPFQTGGLTVTETTHLFLHTICCCPRIDFLTVVLVACECARAVDGCRTWPCRSRCG